MCVFSGLTEGPFCIFGVAFGDIDLDKFVLREIDRIKDRIKRAGIDAKEVDWSSNQSVVYWLAKSFGDDYVAFMPDGWREVFIGRRMSSIRADETGAEFHQSVRKKFDDLFYDVESATVDVHEFGSN